MHITGGLMAGQVLQRLRGGKATCTVSGTCVSDVRDDVLVDVTLRGEPLATWTNSHAGFCRNGDWRATVRGLPTGGPYVLTFRTGGHQVRVRDVFVGDVWVLAGQSNMQGCGNLAEAPEPHPLVRVFYRWEEWGMGRPPINLFPTEAMHEARDRLAFRRAWRLARKCHWGVGPGIFFGREMVERTGGVPQGLIVAAFGGASIDRWAPDRPEDLYADLLARLRRLDQRVAGVLWYQGETDGRLAPEGYGEKLAALIERLRGDLKLPRLPWVVVQIGALHRLEPGQRFDGRLKVQEEQRRLPERVSRVTVVPSMDLPMDDWIHLGTAGHAILGRRLARAAVSLYPPAGRAKGGLVLRRIRLTAPMTDGRPRCIEVDFANVAVGLRSAGRPEGFRLIDAGGEIVPRIHKTALRGSKVLLEACLDNEPAKLDLRLSYGYAADQYCNIEDADGMGLPVFAPQPIEPEGQ